MESEGTSGFGTSSSVMSNSPVKPGISSVARFSTDFATIDQQKFKVANREMEDKWVPVGIDHFLNFLPKPQAERPEFNPEPFRQVYSKGRKESDMYQPMIDALKPFTPQLDLRDSGKYSQKHWGSPDVSVYALGGLTEPETRTKFEKMDSFFEFKTNTTDLAHHKRVFVADGDGSASTRGQMSHYASTVFGTQFRTHLFSIHINKTMCILYRWDRSKVVVSDKFDYTEQPHLAEFFWRFNHASLAERGRDTSATPVTDKMLAARARTSLAQAFRQIPANAELTQLRVDQQNGPSEKFIVYQSLFHDKFFHPPHGRGTRPFPAYHPNSGRLVMLKDTWRVEGYTPEHETYAELHAKNVPHIPEVLAAGDILIDGQPQTCGRDDNQGRRFVLYRIVLGVIGRSLASFTSVYELIRAIYHAFIAHRHAVEDAGLLHRDISIGNILIVDNGGLLIDWEMAKKICEAGTARMTERTGTWQFLSGNLVDKRKPFHVHCAGDDIESFFHVLTWITVRYGPTNLDPETRRRKLGAYDSAGSDAKIGLLCRGKGHIQDLEVTHSPLSDLLSTLSELFQYRYLDILRSVTPTERWEQILQETEGHGHIAQLLKSWLKTNEGAKDTIAAKLHEVEEKQKDGPEPAIDRNRPMRSKTKCRPPPPLAQTPGQASGSRPTPSEEEEFWMEDGSISLGPGPTSATSPTPELSTSDSEIPTQGPPESLMSQGPSQRSNFRRAAKPQQPQIDETLLRRSSRLRKTRDEESSLELEEPHTSGSKRKSRGNLKDGGTRGSPAKKRRST